MPRIHSYSIHQLQNSFLLIPEEAVTPDSADAMIETLYHEHHGWLFAWLRKKLSYPHHAADIAQDTFARLLAMSHLPHMEVPRAYLVTTASRILIDEARRQRIEQTYLAELSRQAETHDGFPSPEQILIAVQTLEKISAMLAGLAKKPRQAFLLHYLEGSTHAAIAIELGVSERMVRNYLTQALVHCYQAVAS